MKMENRDWLAIGVGVLVASVVIPLALTHSSPDTPSPPLQIEKVSKPVELTVEQRAEKPDIISGGSGIVERGGPVSPVHHSVPKKFKDFLGWVDNHRAKLARSGDGKPECESETYIPLGKLCMSHHIEGKEPVDQRFYSLEWAQGDPSKFSIRASISHPGDGLNCEVLNASQTRRFCWAGSVGTAPERGNPGIPGAVAYHCKSRDSGVEYLIKNFGLNERQPENTALIVFSHGYVEFDPAFAHELVWKNKFRWDC